VKPLRRASDFTRQHFLPSGALKPWRYLTPTLASLYRT
jgi:hypothetical protein